MRKLLMVLMGVILFLCIIRIYTNFNGSPVVGDWVSFIGMEFSLQLLYDYFKNKYGK